MTTTPQVPARAPAPWDDTALFRRQESTLVALNLAALAALVLVHLAFSGMLGVPSFRVVAAIAVFFLLQTVEFIVLQSPRVPFTARVARIYAPVSVALKLLAGVIIGVLGGAEDTHYAVLLVLPVVSAAFRFGLAGTLLAVLAGGALSFAQPALYYRAHPPVMAHEFYEAGTVVLIFFVVGIVVSNLAGQLRRDRGRLQASLDELERTRDRLVTEEKLGAVGRLSGAIAHEVRNPIAMILSSIERARTPGVVETERDEMLGIVVEEARRLDVMVGDFLLYARPRPVEPRPTDARDLLDYMAGLARARSAEAGIEVRVEAEPGRTLHLDPFQLQQALLNLLLNALDAAEPGSAVRLGARFDPPPGEGVVFYVENRGAPIPPEAAERLFEPFFTTRPTGTGLGLAIARNIARAHGGDLTLASDTPGATVFELRIPGPVVPTTPGAGG